MCKIKTLVVFLVSFCHGRRLCSSPIAESALWNVLDGLPCVQSFACLQSPARTQLHGRVSPRGEQSAARILRMLLLAFRSRCDGFCAGVCLRGAREPLLLSRCPSGPRLPAKGRAGCVRAAAREEFGLLRDSALPLIGKRVLLLSSRTEVAPSMTALVQAGARPIWCPIFRVEPLTDQSDQGELQDAIMRLVEYEYLIVLSPHSIEAIAQCFLSLADGSKELVDIMFEAAETGIVVIGPDVRLANKKICKSDKIFAPLDPSLSSLVKSLVDMDYQDGVKDLRILVSSGRIGNGIGDANTQEQPRAEATVKQELEQAGAIVDTVNTHVLVRSNAADIAAELDLVRNGEIDVICATNAEELSELLQLAAEGKDDVPDLLHDKLILAYGDETAEAARELAPSAKVILVGVRTTENAVVGALERHFGAGKLLL